MDNIEFFDTLTELLERLTDFPELPWQQPRWQSASLHQALSDVWYQANQDGRETRTYHGLVVGAQLDDIAQINALKHRLYEQLKIIKHSQPGWQEDFTYRLPQLNSRLASHQLSRLHLKQLWRQIPVIEARLSTLRYSWYQSGRSIKRLTVKEVSDRLAKQNQALDHIQRYWQLLNQLPEHEPLALVQSQAPTLRANVWYQDTGRRRAFNAPMPIFVRHAPSKVSFPEPYQPGQRKRAQRSDVQIDPEPYLPALRIHRYLS